MLRISADVKSQIITRLPAYTRSLSYTTGCARTQTLGIGDRSRTAQVSRASTRDVAHRHHTPLKSPCSWTGLPPEASRPDKIVHRIHCAESFQKT